MKIGILSPTTWQFVEKMAALFPEGVEVAGPLSDDRHYWNDYRRKLDEWGELGLQVSLNLVSYDRIDFSQYDLLIESVEAFAYARDWASHCLRVECPIMLKACWTKDPRHRQARLPWRYRRKMRDFPVLLEMPAHVKTWQSAGFKDVNVLFNPVGEWWFAREWTGRKEQILFVLSGTRNWRGDPSWYGFDLWEKLCRAFPGRTYHQDGHESYKTSLEMAQLFSESRLFVNLDRPYGQGERPLTLAFTEALSAGMPVVARDLPGLSYKNYIDGNGLCTNDFEAMLAFIDNCLSDLDFARACSARSRQIARHNFSYAALQPRYAEIIQRSIAVFEQKKEEEAEKPYRRFFKLFQ